MEARTMPERPSKRSLTPRERFLVTLLGWAIALAVLGALILHERGRAAEAQARAVLLEQQVRRLAGKVPQAGDLTGRIERARRALELERGRFYAPGEMDPYRFGALIRERLVSRGLRIDRYQTLEPQKGSLLEFSVQGDALALVSFFREVSLADKYWSIPFVSVSVKGPQGLVQSVFRIQYEQIP